MSFKLLYEPRLCEEAKEGGGSLDFCVIALNRNR